MSRPWRIVAAAMLAACHNGAAENAVAGVVISPSRAVLSVGDQLQLSASLTDSDGGALAGRGATWTSSAPAAAVVSADGFVTAAGVGNAVITAASGGQSATAQVSVVRLTLEASARIGPDGGAVVVGDPHSPLYGVSLTVPPGALPGEQTISINSPDPEPPLPPGLELRGHTAVFRPEGLTFSQPAQLTMPLGEVHDAQLLFTTTPDGHLSPVSPIDVDAEGPDQETSSGMITAWITHFSDLLTVYTKAADAAATSSKTSGCEKVPFIPGRCKSCNKPRAGPLDQIIVHSTHSGPAMSLADVVADAATNYPGRYAHYYIGDHGEIVQVAPDNQYAVQVASGNADLINLHAIGIELYRPTNQESFDKYPPAQIAALKRLVGLLMKQYAIPPGNVSRHKDHSASKDHQDPFGWDDSDWNAVKTGFAPIDPSDPGLAGCDLNNGHNPATGGSDGGTTGGGNDGGTTGGGGNDGGVIGGGTLYQISVVIAGSGSGTVGASPPGYRYPVNTDVTLTATPDAQSTFVGWGGACGGTLPCTLRVSGDAIVTANFAAIVPDAGPPPADGGGVCGVQQVAGGDTPDSRQIEMNVTSGTFDFTYNTYTVADRIVVSYQGLPLYDTGCVGAADTRSLFFGPGSSTQLNVSVTPNCSGNTSGTAWQYTIGCPH